MKPLTKGIIVVLSVFILVGLTMIDTHIQTTTLLGMTIMDHETYYDFIKDKEYVYDSEVTLSYEDTPIPYIESFGSYLFPIGSSDDGLITTNKDYGLILVYDDANQFMTNMDSNIPFELCLYTHDSYDVKTIIFTNMPLVIIDGYTNIDNENYGAFTLIDHDNDRHLYEITTCDVKYHRRGNYTATAPKANFKLTLLDEKWESEAHDLLGLRDDDDWILQSMVTDTSKVKDKLAIMFWNSISDRYQLGFEYVEVIIDGAYMGIYGLATPVDHKTFNGSKKDDYLIKVDDWGQVGEYSDLTNWIIDEDTCSYNEYEVKPCDASNKDEVVEIITIIHDRLDELTDSFDLTNCANYQLFLNLTNAVDNTYKNQRLLVRSSSTGLTIVKSVWDFDFCFQYDDDNTGIYTDLLVPDGITNDPSYFAHQAITYQNLRQTTLSTDALVSTIESYDRTLKSGGALLRDEATWDYSGWALQRVDHDSALSYLVSGLTSRLEFLDDYYRSE